MTIYTKATHGTLTHAQADSNMLQILTNSSSNKIKTSGLITFGTSWSNINTTKYSWSLPSSGTYFLYATLRAFDNGGYAKLRLSTGASNSERMMIEIGGFANVGTTFNWLVTVGSATTIYLQGASSSSGNTGIQADGNGYNEVGYIRLS